MRPEADLSNEREFNLIKEKVSLIKASGYGEVRILIKKGIIYRIISSKDDLLTEE